MIRLLFSISLACLLLAVPARAQEEDTQPPLDRFFSMINTAGRGHTVAEYLLDDSFAHHLIGEDAAQNVSELSLREVRYDPASDPAMLAGTAYYHLSEPIALLRQVGSGWEEVLPRIFEIRMLWLAGQPDRALAWAEQTITEIEEAQWDDRYMTSILADAAVMAHRAGRAEQAAVWFARARACADDCPDDVAFFFVENSLNIFLDDYTDFDAAALRQNALDAVAEHAPDAPHVVSEIDLEHELMSGNAATAIRAALRRAQSPGEMTQAEQRQSRYLAQRLIREEGAWNLPSGRNSNAGFIRAYAASDEDADAFPLPVATVQAWWRARYRETPMLRLLPVVSQLMAVSDRSSDRVLARMFQTWVVTLHDADAGRQEMDSLLQDARAAGFDIAELQELYGELIFLAQTSGHDAAAEQLLSEIRPCVVRVCDEDLYFQFVIKSGRLPKFARPSGHVDLLIEFADPAVRQWVPDSPEFLSRLYFSGRLQDHPLDGARRDRIAIGLLESDADVVLSALISKASSVVETLTYAGFYAEALDLGDRIAARRGFETEPALVRAPLLVRRARAAFRLGNGRAEDLYTQAITAVSDAMDDDGYWPNLGERLARELLDTPFLDLTEAYYARWDPDRRTTFTARLFARQGRAGEAARVLRLQRRQVEQAGGAASLPDVYLRAAEDALRVGNLDLYAALILRAKRIEDGQDVPEDHPALYTRYYDLKALAWQEAAYLDAAGDPTEAARVRALGGNPRWFHGSWVGLPDRPSSDALATFERRKRESHTSTYDVIRHIIEIRDQGNYQAAAQYMSNYAWVAEAAEANGKYVDAQTLWQMAFTFARVGDTGPAFDLMNRAARIAATLSFAGAGGADGGTLQLLERDRWRYLLFVDIAWAAVSGQVPEDLSVVSTY